MKKLIALLLISCICFSLIACAPIEPVMKEKNTTPSDSDQPQAAEPETPQQDPPAEEPETPQQDPPAEEPETPQQDPPAEEPETITLEQFLDKRKGVWIFVDTLWFFDGGNPCFEALMFTDKQCTTGVYPGSSDIPGLYEGFAQISENTYRIDLLFEEMSEDSYWGYSPEVHSSVVFVCTGENTMLLQGADGSYSALLYGGATFEDADATARTYTK